MLSKFERNRTRATNVPEQDLEMLSESQNDRMTKWQNQGQAKNHIPRKNYIFRGVLKLRLEGGIKVSSK